MSESTQVTRNDHSLGDAGDLPVWSLPTTATATRQRLAAALRQANSEVQRLHARPADASLPPDELALMRAKYAEAWRAARGNHRYEAWDLLLQLERMLAAWLPPETQQVLLKRYTREAEEKLNNWRAGFVAEVAKSPAMPTGTVLVEVMKAVHEGSQNQQQKIEWLREQATMLVVLLLATLFGLLSLAGSGGLDWAMAPRGVAPANLYNELQSGVLVGLFGGLLSVAFALSKTTYTASSIPLLRSAWSVQVLRPMLGAATAVPVILLAHAGLIDLGDKGAPLILSLCFLAGYSERWFIEKIDAIASSTSPKPRKGP